MDAVALQLILGRANLTAGRLRRALERLGTQPGIAAAAALIGESTPLLRGLGLPPAASRWLSAPDHAAVEADRRWLERQRIEVIDALSTAYPSRLAAIEDAPAVLYVRGAAATLSEPQLAIVGTRTPTAPGRATAQRFAAELARAGLTITSGLALGIDAASHQGALAAGGRTIAVLASGLDRVYPPEHRGLSERILTQGALVTELPRKTAPVRWSFPRRNRLISGLSLGTLVVEAAEDSGSLITARLALKQGRRLFAIPGPIQNLQVRGCHQLIREGAKLVEGVGDILREITELSAKLDDGRPHSSADQVTPEGLALDKEHKILLDALGFEAASVDMLVERTGFPSHCVVSMLLILELQGAIGGQAGGRYVRL
jgi:DNA processing protein